MQNKHTFTIKYLALLVVLGLYFPSLSFAAVLSPSVPVSDDKVAASTGDLLQTTEKFRQAFQKYTEQFDKRIYDDPDESLRTLLSLNPKAGQTAELYLPGQDEYANGGKTPTLEDLDIKKFCDTRPVTNPNAAKPSVNGAWERLSDNGFIDEASLPNFGTVRVNDSTSLSCLMQELVEYDKLLVNVQIHTLLRDYINSALATSLAQRTAGLVSKANLDWVKKGNVITKYDADGVPISQESFNGSNAEDFKNFRVSARANSIMDRVLNEDPNKPTLNICNSYKFTAAKRLAVQNHNMSNDDLESFSDEVSCTAVNKTNPDAGLFASDEDMKAYVNNGTKTSKRDPFSTYAAMLSNDANTSMGLRMKMESEMYRKQDQIAKEVDNQLTQGGGYMPQIECLDSNCDKYRVVTPGSAVQSAANKAINQQTDFLNNVNSQETLAAAPTNNFSSTNILNQGLMNYDTDNLYPNQAIGTYIGDFLNGIRSGYYDLQSGTIDWASGAMLQIYDATMTNGNAFTNAPSTQTAPRQ